MNGPYDVGDLVKVFVTFTDEDGVEAEPDTITLVVRPPDGATVLYTLGFDHDDMAQPVSGYYGLDILMDQSGPWEAEWRGVGAVTAVEPLHWFVRESRVGESDES